MGLEVATYIADLVATNPMTSDAVGQGDDHLRLIKSALKATLPNMGGRLGNAISVPLGYTVLSTDNTAILDIPAAAGVSTSHTISLPNVASITAGFFFDVNMTSLNDSATLVATGAGTIEGAASYEAGPRSFVRVFYAGSNAWRVAEMPCYRSTGAGLFFDGSVTISAALAVGSTLSVGGATRLMADVSVSGALFVGGLARVGALTVSGVANLQSSVSIGGGLSVDADANFGGRVTISGTLRAQNEIHCAAGVSISGVLIVTGAATFSGPFSVSGIANFAQQVSIGGAAILSSTLSVSGAAHMKSTLSVGGVATFASTVTISGTCVLTGGQLKFPATQNASADANTLDDYEEGTWTITITFTTPGNLSVTYSSQSGNYTKVGRQVQIDGVLVTATFTHTTASGALVINTLPFTPAANTMLATDFQGITKATHTQFTVRVNGSSTSMNVFAAGSGATRAQVAAGDMPTGGSVVFIMGGVFIV